MLKKKKKCGYISIEAILVAGVLLVMAVINTTAYREKSSGLVDAAVNEMNRVDNVYNPGE